MADCYNTFRFTGFEDLVKDSIDESSSFNGCKLPSNIYSKNKDDTVANHKADIIEFMKNRFNML